MNRIAFAEPCGSISSRNSALAPGTPVSQYAKIACCPPPLFDQAKAARVKVVPRLVELGMVIAAVLLRKSYAFEPNFTGVLTVLTVASNVPFCAPSLRAISSAGPSLSSFGDVPSPV